MEDDDQLPHFNKCSNDRDSVTQIEWSDQSPSLFIFFYHGGKEFIKCYDKQSLKQWLKQPTSILANWIPKPGKVIDSTGMGGQPGKKRFYKFYTGEYISKESVDKYILQGKHKLLTATFDRNVRLGNVEGTFGQSQLHGQSKFPTYKLEKYEPMGETKITDLHGDVLRKIALGVSPKTYGRLASVSKGMRKEIGGERMRVEKFKQFLEEKRKEKYDKLIKKYGTELAAVKKAGWQIKYIKNPSEKVKLAAVERDGYAIEFIKNPSEKTQLAAVERDAFLMEYIKNPSKEVQLAAVKKDGNVIQYIKNPSKEVQLAAVKRSGIAIQYIENPSEEAQLAAVKRAGWQIKFIKNPSLKVQMAAVEQDRKAIKHIKEPSIDAQMAALQRDKGVTEYLFKYL